MKPTHKANVTRSPVSKLTSKLSLETLGRKRNANATTNALVKSSRTIRSNRIVFEERKRIVLAGEQIEPGRVYYDEFIQEYYLTLEPFSNNGRPCWRVFNLDSGEVTEQLERMIVEDPDVEWL